MLIEVITSPLVVAISVILAIVLIAAAMYLQYTQNKNLASERDQVISGGSQKISKQIESLGANLAKLEALVGPEAQVIAEFFPEGYSSLNLTLTKKVSAEGMIWKLLDQADSYRILADRRLHVGTRWDSEDVIFFGLAQKGEKTSEVLLLKMTVNYRNMELFELAPEHDAQLFGTLVPVVEKVVLMLPKNCDGECSLETYQMVQGVLADTPALSLAPKPKAVDTLTYKVFSGNPVMPWRAATVKVDTPQTLLGLSYPVLTLMDDTPRNVAVSKLLTVLPSEWTKYRYNLLLSGDPASGKTSLGRLIGAAAAQQNVAVYSVTAQQLPSLVNLGDVYVSGPALLIIDEADYLDPALLGTVNSFLDGLNTLPNLSVLLIAKDPSKFSDQSVIREGRIHMHIHVNPQTRVEAEKLLSELKAANPDLSWGQLPENKESFLLGEIWALGKPKSITEML